MHMEPEDTVCVQHRANHIKLYSVCFPLYKERVECYPRVKVTQVNIHTKGCEACELHRTGRFCVRLSGQLYHTHTLQEDQFMPDDSQVTNTGRLFPS